MTNEQREIKRKKRVIECAERTGNIQRFADAIGTAMLRASSMAASR